MADEHEVIKGAPATAEVLAGVVARRGLLVVREIAVITLLTLAISQAFKYSDPTMPPFTALERSVVMGSLACSWLAAKWLWRKTAPALRRKRGQS